LPLSIQRERVERLGKVLDELEKQRAAALKTMVKLARGNAMYKPLRTIPGVGPVFASMFISEVGCAERFRTRSQLWAYGGLSITTHESSEFEIRGNRISRRVRATKTRGLTRSFNRILKYLFKQVAMTLSRTAWKEYYQGLLIRSKNANNAQLTTARKVASVMLNIAKTGEKYDLAKVFNKEL
jgi:transposase